MLFIGLQVYASRRIRHLVTLLMLSEMEALLPGVRHLGRMSNELECDASR